MDPHTIRRAHWLRGFDRGLPLIEWDDLAATLEAVHQQPTTWIPVAPGELCISLDQYTDLETQCDALQQLYYLITGVTLEVSLARGFRVAPHEWHVKVCHGNRDKHPASLVMERALMVPLEDQIPCAREALACMPTCPDEVHRMLVAYEEDFVHGKVDSFLTLHDIRDELRKLEEVQSPNE